MTKVGVVGFSKTLLVGCADFKFNVQYNCICANKGSQCEKIMHLLEIVMTF